MKSFARLAWTQMRRFTSALALCQLFSTTPVLAATPVQIDVHYSPPWIYEAPDKSVIGIEADLLRAALRPQGYEPSFNIVSYSRLLEDFGAKRVQFASPVAALVSFPGMYRTQPYLPYRDVVISLKKSNLRIDAIADLADKRIVAYQAASKVLGPEFGKMAQNNPAYRERAAREIQIEQLFEGRVDAVVGELRILTYVANKLRGPGLIQVHDIFPVDAPGGVSWSAELAHAVDRGMQKLRESGEYQKIIDASR